MAFFGQEPPEGFQGFHDGKLELPDEEADGARYEMDLKQVFTYLTNRVDSVRYHVDSIRIIRIPLDTL